MAKRYSNSDQRKLLRDTLADFRAKGADMQGAKIVHPGGIVEGCKQLRRESSSVVDQSQEQTERNRAHAAATQRQLDENAGLKRKR